MGKLLLGILVSHSGVPRSSPALPSDKEYCSLSAWVLVIGMNDQAGAPGLGLAHSGLVWALDKCTRRWKMNIALSLCL